MEIHLRVEAAKRGVFDKKNGLILEEYREGHNTTKLIFQKRNVNYYKNYTNVW